MIFKRNQGAVKVFNTRFFVDFVATEKSGPDFSSGGTKFKSLSPLISFEIKKNQVPDFQENQEELVFMMFEKSREIRFPASRESHEKSSSRLLGNSKKNKIMVQVGNSREFKSQTFRKVKRNQLLDF